MLLNRYANDIKLPIFMYWCPSLFKTWETLQYTFQYNITKWQFLGNILIILFLFLINLSADSVFFRKLILNKCYTMSNILYMYIFIFWHFWFVCVYVLTMCTYFFITLYCVYKFSWRIILTKSIFQQDYVAQFT